MSQPGICADVMAEVLSCILSSRINPSRAQMDSFNRFIASVHSFKTRICHTSLADLISGLIVRENRLICGQALSKEGVAAAVVEFYLESPCDQERICLEAWEIQFEPLLDFKQNNEQSARITALIFEQLLFLLTNQPLFVQYVKNSKIRDNYQLSYNIETSGHSNRLNKLASNIRSLEQADYRERVCPQYKISYKSYSATGMYWQFLNQAPRVRALSCEEENKPKIQKPQPRSCVSMESPATLEEDPEVFECLELVQKNRKTSLYEIYDQKLDFRVLSSCEESFQNSPKGSVKEIPLNFQDKATAEQQFQLLRVSDDQVFLEVNRLLFIGLSKMEGEYYDF